MRLLPNLTNALTQRLNPSLLIALLSGALLPFGFAPFHLPGLALLGLAFFFTQLSNRLSTSDKPTKQPVFLLGFAFGLGYFGLGISWVFVSIHEYGHLNLFISGFITLTFIAYLSLYTGAVAYLYQRIANPRAKLANCFIFSAIWCLCEYGRATFLTGFPWLMLGFGQIDTPLKELLPLIGLYGVSFIACLAATFLAVVSQERKTKQLPWLVAFIALLTTPFALKDTVWTNQEKKPISVGVIQANLSMKDKWDETLFWDLVNYYKKETEKLLGKKQLIIMPESAIPAPDSYVKDLLNLIHQESLNTDTSILLGIPEEPSLDRYYNSLMALGKASGSYQKNHLVPFGEYIPKPFEQIVNWLSIPLSNLSEGREDQTLVQVRHHPIASLICYELAYPQLLRKQLPEAEWIVSISDIGWFGHSFAIYQQQQMAQALSMQTGRYHIVANNDGLSSVINAQGVITDSLPAYQAGILESHIHPATGASPWVIWGDSPVLLFSLLILCAAIIQQLAAVWITRAISTGAV